MTIKSAQPVVKYGEIIGLAKGDRSSLATLDTSPRDGYLNAAELGRGLLAAQAPVVGRLFSAGIAHPRQRPGLVAAFRDLNPAQQYGVLRRMPSSQQATLVNELSKMTTPSDLNYLWYQFVFAESGVLGGIFLHHLHVINPQLAESLPMAAEAVTSGEFRKQFQDHFKIAQPTRRKLAQATKMAHIQYYPSPEEAENFLKAQGVAIENTIPPDIQSLQPHLKGRRPVGAMAVVHNGRGYVLLPKPGFMPKTHAVEIATGMTRGEIKEQYKLGDELLENNRHDEAIRAYQHILERNPKECLAYLKIGMVWNDRYNKGEKPLLKQVIHHYQLAVQGWDRLITEDSHYLESRGQERIHYDYAKVSIGILEQELP